MKYAGGNSPGPSGLMVVGCTQVVVGTIERGGRAGISVESVVPKLFTFALGTKTFAAGTHTTWVH